MPYTMPVPTRPAWQQLRDKNNVPKGAAKVSIGDDLDAVAKSFSLDTLSKHQQAVTKLGKDLDVYMATTEKKYPAFKPIVTKDVKKKVDAHAKFVADLIKAKTEYYPRYKGVSEAYDNIRFHNKGTPKDVAKAMERLLGCVAAFALVDLKWEPKRKNLNRMMSECERTATLTTAHKKQIEDVLKELKI